MECGRKRAKIHLPNEEFGHLSDVFSKPGLKSQFPRASHNKERAMSLVAGTETDGMRITQRKIHRGRTGLRRADKEWTGR